MILSLLVFFLGLDSFAQSGCSWNLSLANQKVWDGSVDDNWQNDQNWTPVGEPASNSNVLIPDGCPNDPRIYDNVNSGTVRIAPGAVLNWDGGSTALLNVTQMF